MLVLCECAFVCWRKRCWRNEWHQLTFIVIIISSQSCVLGLWILGSPKKWESSSSSFYWLHGTVKHWLWVFALEHISAIVDSSGPLHTPTLSFEAFCVMYFSSLCRGMYDNVGETVRRQALSPPVGKRTSSTSKLCLLYLNENPETMNGWK